MLNGEVEVPVGLTVLVAAVVGSELEHEDNTASAAKIINPPMVVTAVNRRWPKG